MNITPRATLLLLCMVAVDGCAASAPVFVSRIHADIPPDTRLRAIGRALASLGWSMCVDHLSNRIVATANETATTRDVATVELSDRGEIRIRVRTELAAAGGQWIAPRTVGDSYQFSREQLIAREIQRTAARVALSLDGHAFASGSGRSGASAER